MNNQDFGKFISELRKEKGITQKELADKLNVTDKAVSRWENGKNYPDIEIFESISKELGVSISELIACKKIETKEEAVAITEKAYIGEIKKGKKKIKKALIALVIAVLVIVSIFVVNVYGDNIYDAFVFSKSDVLMISKNEFRVSKNNTEAFEDYMLEDGWYYNGNIQSGVFENEKEKAIFTFSEKKFYTQVSVRYIDKIYPSFELLEVYGKCLYDIKYENNKVIFSNGEESLENKSTWTIAWYQDYKTAKMQSAKLVVEEDNKTIHEEDVEINIIEDENDFIHGWNNFVLIKPCIMVEYDNPKSARAYVVLKDSDDIEYKVCLNKTEYHEKNPNDSSNDIIIKYKNSTFSIWEYYDLWGDINENLK